ncbi:MAG: hypothetical protein J5I98_26550 [Phaeodactylibacter sp.]|nr:hypothetical protein [Phaeodactylibacter sp.]
MKNIKRFSLLAFSALLLWIAASLLLPRHSNLREFDPAVVGQLDAAMWRSYYEGRKLRLFLQLSRLVRRQFHAPYWRSFPIAYQAARAATTFQSGANRSDYARALSPLEKYFGAINRLSDRPFDVKSAARSELEWWIIRREPQHATADWERLLAEVAATLYHQPAKQFAEYARLRVEAMVLRDSKGPTITETDWKEITALLEESWQALWAAVQ